MILLGTQGSLDVREILWIIVTEDKMYSPLKSFSNNYLEILLKLSVCYMKIIHALYGKKQIITSCYCKTEDTLPPWLKRPMWLDILAMTDPRLEMLSFPAQPETSFPSPSHQESRGKRQEEGIRDKKHSAWEASWSRWAWGLPYSTQTLVACCTSSYLASTSRSWAGDSISPSRGAWETLFTPQAT